MWGNYAYYCKTCNWETTLGEMVPAWDELFDYHGYAIESRAQLRDEIDPEQLRAVLEAIRKTKK